MNPSILNIRNLGPRVTWPPDVVRIDRRSRWGNPYGIGVRCQPWCHGSKMDRGMVIDHYRHWLVQVTLRNPDFLEPLRGKHLACWCAPLPCHGDVILEWLEAHPQ